MTRALVALVALSGVLVAASARGDTPRVVVGSKAFPESWILGEALRALAAGAGARADHAQNLGGTEIVVAALQAAQIDVYAEYTGTIDEVILPKRNEARTPSDRRAGLLSLGLEPSDPLGFNDSYALAMSPDAQKRTGVARLSDLVLHPELRLGLTHEFLGRRDGFPGLSARYGLTHDSVRGIQHELAFEAIRTGAIDVMDVYTTDPQIERLGLVLLDDDRAFFPRYDAVLLYRLDLGTRAPHALAAMKRLVGAVDVTTMTRANAALVIDHASVEEAARILPIGSAPAPAPRSAFAGIAKDTLRHLEIVFASLAAAVFFGVPIGVAASRARRIGGIVMSLAGVVQTIPSLALLALLVPLFGIGAWPAIVALFLYGLLPIVRNTYTGLVTIPPALSESADALGLPSGAKLRRVLMPLAAPSILAGIKTSAVINVGTATIAALVGAEGLGNPILQGISLRDTTLILRGALPAAGLALVVETAFGLAERVIVPRGLCTSRRRTRTPRSPGG